MMKRKTWLTIIVAALLIFCTAVLAEGANRNVPLDSALDAALNAPGSGIAFANGSAYPWQVVEIDGRTAAKSGNAGAANSSSAVSAQVTIAEGQSLSFDWNVDGEPTTGALAMWDYLVFIVDGEYIDYIHSVEENTPLGWETSHGLRMRRERIPWSGHITRMHRTIPVRTAVILTTLL